MILWIRSVDARRACRCAATVCIVLLCVTSFGVRHTHDTTVVATDAEGPTAVSTTFLTDGICPVCALSHVGDFGPLPAGTNGIAAR